MTKYIAVRVNGAVQWAMVDTGAMVSIVSTAFANFAGLVEENHANVRDSGFRVKGIGDNLSGAAVIQTRISFGMKVVPEREFVV